MKYHFNIIKEEDGTWRFELNEIKLLLNDYVIKDEKHWIKNPTKAAGYFVVNGLLYGILNEIKTSSTVEEFYENMYQQYLMFRTGLKNNKH